LGDRGLAVKMRNNIIDGMSKEEMRALSEVAANFLGRNIPVNMGELSKLRNYKSTLRKLASRVCSFDERKLLVKQKGGFLPFLLPLIAPLVAKAAVGAVGAAVSGVVGKALSRKRK